MIRAVVAAVVVLIVSATTAMSFQENAPAVNLQMAIDMNTTGNGSTAVGASDSCVSVNVGDTFDVDVVVKGVPVVRSDRAALGLAGYGFNFKFDPAVVNVIAAQNNFMVNASAPFERIVGNYNVAADSNPPGPLPGTLGNVRIDFLDISEDYEDGNGVLSRLTLRAVGSGATTLTLDSHQDQQPAAIIFMAGGFPYGLSEMQDGLVNVGTPCDAGPVPTPFDPPDTYFEAYNLGTPGPTPTPGPPTPTPTLGPSDVDEGDTRVSIDTITTGNGAGDVGEIDECGSAEVGDTFTIDIVIEEVEDLLAFEVPVSYNPAVLKIIDSDVNFILARSSGSQIFDASNQTPNTTGFYRSGAVDQAEPAAPESGDGVLVRLTMEAITRGTSIISAAPVDQNFDGRTDTGVLLKNTDNLAIGGPIFRGETNGAEVRVGTECTGGGGRVTQAPGRTPDGNGSGGGNGDDDGGSGWLVIAAGVAIAALAIGAGTALYMRKRGGGGTSAPAE